MSTPTPVSNGQTLLALLQNDALLSFGPQVLTLLGDVQAAKLDPLKVGAAWLKFQGAIMADLLTFETQVAGQLLTFLNQKVQNALNAAQVKSA